jgi:hypothetical protein
MFMRVNSKCAHQARPPLGPYWGRLGRRSPLGDYHYLFERLSEVPFVRDQNLLGLTEENPRRAWYGVST